MSIRRIVAALRRPVSVMAPGLVLMLAAAPASHASARTVTSGESATSATPGTSAAGTATVSGTLTQPGGALLPGMRIQAQVIGTAPASCTPAGGCFATYTDTSGRYSMAGLAPATYELSVLDGARSVDLRPVTISAGTSELTVPLSLGPASVPANTVARHARRDLAWLRAERARDGV